MESLVHGVLVVSTAGKDLLSPPSKELMSLLPVPRRARLLPRLLVLQEVVTSDSDLLSKGASET